MVWLLGLEAIVQIFREGQLLIYLYITTCEEMPTI